MKPPIRASSIICVPKRSGPAKSSTRSRSTMRTDIGAAPCFPAPAGSRSCSISTNLPRLEDGDALKLEDGRLVRRGRRARGTRRDHLGQPGAPLACRLAPRQSSYAGGDHGRSDLFRAGTMCSSRCCGGSGSPSRPVTRAFRPERGAYEHRHGHDLEHGLGHADGVILTRLPAPTPSGKEPALHRQPGASR